MAPCDAKGKPDPARGWEEIPEPAPYSGHYGTSVVARRMFVALAIKRLGYEYALFETDEGRRVLIPLHKLVDV